jgi:hypothetical protein
MPVFETRRMLATLIATGLAGCLAATAQAACAFRIDATASPGRAAIDGLVMLRYASGARGAALMDNVGGGLTATAVADHITQQRAVLDVNGNGEFDTTDALIITRHMLGLRGAALLPQPFSMTGPPALRATGDAAQLFIDLGCPVSLQVAALGAPKIALVNGLATVLDANHRVARHALDAAFEAVPAAYANAPMIAPLKALVRRDALIVYLPNVQGAADYRVHVEGRNVMACAGFRQRASIARLDGNGTVIRELLQTVELPGLAAPGSYRVIVEALDRPCPFTGMPAHTSAAIPIAPGQLLLSGLTGGSVPFRSFTDATAQYGSEIINGQGASSDWFVQSGQLRGQAVPPGSPTATPIVIARSAIRVVTPFADEGVNAPIIDVGPNAVFDDFSTDAIASFGRIASRSFGGSDAIQGPFGQWYFWGTSAQSAQGQSASDPPLGVQVWRRHGRLNITLADWAQDVFSAVHFSSLATRPVALDTPDPAQYSHSFFRVDSGATGRRYWHWMMCGAADASNLVDPASNTPRIRPLLRSDFFIANGVNPTEPADGEPLTANHRRECLSVFHRATGNPDTPRLPDGSDGPRPNQELIVTINPEGRARGVINLAPAVFDRGYGENAFRWRLNAAGQYAGPLFEPFDQQQPLTHYDIFTRKDRVVIFVNGRQGACINLAARPLAMNYGLIVYGQVLYHSNAEYGEYYVPERPAGNPYQAPYASFHLSMNTVAADSRAWDAVGHTEKIAIPPLFNFDLALCRAPGTTAVQ